MYLSFEMWTNNFYIPRWILPLFWYLGCMNSLWAAYLSWKKLKKCVILCLFHSLPIFVVITYFYSIYILNYLKLHSVSPDYCSRGKFVRWNKCSCLIPVAVFPLMELQTLSSLKMWAVFHFTNKRLMQQHCSRVVIVPFSSCNEVKL